MVLTHLFIIGVCGKPLSSIRLEHEKKWKKRGRDKNILISQTEYGLK